MEESFAAGESQILDLDLLERPVALPINLYVETGALTLEDHSACLDTGDQSLEWHLDVLLHLCLVLQKILVGFSILNGHFEELSMRSRLVSHPVIRNPHDGNLDVGPRALMQRERVPASNLRIMELEACCAVLKLKSPTDLING